MRSKVTYLGCSFTFRVNGYADVIATYMPSGNKWHVRTSLHAMYIPEARSRQVESKTRAAEIVQIFLTKINDESRDTKKG